MKIENKHSLFYLYAIATNLIILLFIIGCKSKSTEIENSFYKSADSITSVQLSLVGDLMCHSPQYLYAFIKNDSFDFSVNYKFVKNLFDSSDYVFGNLETVLAGKEKKYSGYPDFNTPDDYARALKSAGFDFLFTSNNHSLDQGISGLERTLKTLDELNLNYTGTFLSQQRRDSLKIITVKDISIAVLSYTYGTNGNYIPANKKFLINLIDTNLIKEDLTKAKLHETDIILTYFHFGNEYQTKPSAYQKKIVECAIKNGSDLIIASHPHVLQPVKFYKGYNNLDSVLVAYSMGNFISNQRNRFTDGGAILNINLSKNLFNDSLYIDYVKLIPTWVFKGQYSKKPSYIILPKNSRSNFLSAKDSTTMNQSFNDTENILSAEINTNKIAIQ